MNSTSAFGSRASADSPLISVVMPVHNGERHLLEALHSVLKTGPRDLELIAVDDGSSDGSRALLDAESARDPRLKVLAGPGGGISAATNLGLAAARGRYIAQMDQDDLSRPERLERQLVFLERHPDVGVVGGQMRRFGLPGLSQGSHPEAHDDIKAMSVFACPVHGGAAMLRRSVLDGRTGPYRSAEDFSQDYGLWTRLLLDGVRMANLPDFVLDYRVHEAQVSSRHAALQSRVSDGIRLAWLRALGLDPNPAELELHNAASEARWGRSLDGIKSLEVWFLKLRAAGQASGILDSRALDRVLARRWSAALWSHRGLGKPLFRLALGSPLRRLPDPIVWKSWVAPWGAFLPVPKA